MKVLVCTCSHVAGASGEAWKQGNVDFTGALFHCLAPDAFGSCAAMA